MRRYRPEARGASSPKQTIRCRSPPTPQSPHRCAAASYRAMMPLSFCALLPRRRCYLFRRMRAATDAGRRPVFNAAISQEDAVTLLPRHAIRPRDVQTDTIRTPCRYATLICCRRCYTDTSAPFSRSHARYRAKQKQKRYFDSIKGDAEVQRSVTPCQMQAEVQMRSCAGRPRRCAAKASCGVRKCMVSATYNDEVRTAAARRGRCGGARIAICAAEVEQRIHHPYDEP